MPTPQPLVPLEHSVNSLGELSRNKNTTKTELAKQEKEIKTRLRTLSKRGKKWAVIAALFAAVLAGSMSYARTNSAKYTAMKYMIAHIGQIETRIAEKLAQGYIFNTLGNRKIQWKNVKSLYNNIMANPKNLKNAGNLIQAWNGFKTSASQFFR